MYAHKKAACELGSVGAAYKNHGSANFTPKPRPKKWERVLSSFLTGRAWHALDATSQLHTSCLHSDVAGLAARGLRFDRERVMVPGFNGIETSVVRYRLRPESYAHARALLGIADDHQQAESAAAYLLASRGQRGAP
jgi:hypothetical protein